MEGGLSKRILVFWETAAILIGGIVGGLAAWLIPTRTWYWYLTLWVVGFLLVACCFLWLPLLYESSHYRITPEYVEYESGVCVCVRTPDAAAIDHVRHSCPQPGVALFRHSQPGHLLHGRKPCDPRPSQRDGGGDLKGRDAPVPCHSFPDLFVGKGGETMNDFERQHPLAVVYAFSKYIVLLLFPLLRSLMLLKGDFRAWAKGAWADILVLLLIVGFGVLQWLCVTYSLRIKGLYVESGVLLNEVRYIPYANLSSAVVERPFYLRPFRVVRVRLETDSGSRSRADVSLLLRNRQAQEMVDAGIRLLIEEPAEEPRIYQPRTLSIAILSLITSNSLTGVLFLSTFISQTGKVLGAQFEQMLVHSLTRLVRFLAFNVPPAAAMAAAILLGGWGIAFLINLINHLGFRAVRKGRLLFIEAGIFVRREYYLSVERINFLTLRQSLLAKLFGFWFRLYQLHRLREGEERAFRAASGGG